MDGTINLLKDNITGRIKSNKECMPWNNHGTIILFKEVGVDERADGFVGGF